MRYLYIGLGAFLSRFVGAAGCRVEPLAFSRQPLAIIPAARVPWERFAFRRAADCRPYGEYRKIGAKTAGFLYKNTF